jgi:hypothetical protein
MMTIKQFWNKVNCWGTKPMDRNTSTLYTSAWKMDTNSKEMENPMQECPDSDAAVGNAGGGSSSEKREDSLPRPSPGYVHSEWFCAVCHEEHIPGQLNCPHCGQYLIVNIRGYWISKSNGTKDYFQEI